MVNKTRLFSTVPIIRHSFATPLTNILMNTEIAVDNLNRLQPETSEIYLKRVLLNAQYLQSVLKLSEPGQSPNFSPKTALQELIALNEGTQLKQHLISRIFLPAIFKLAGSKLAFQEAIVCLLNNAYESYRARQKRRLVFLSAVLGEQALHLSVTDGGQGMNWLTQKLSTTQLYSTKERHSGLGLYFVKKTVEQELHGRFQLFSRPLHGTTVALTFPRSRHQPVAKISFGLNY
jgi:signal transduction histidine kinase